MPIKPDAEGATVVKLSKPYNGINDIFEELVLREPRAKDFIVSGVPVEVIPTADSFQTKFHPVEMTAFLAALTERMPADIQMLHPKDWMAAAYAVVPFFVPA